MLDGTSAIHWAAQSGYLPLIASLSANVSTYLDHKLYSQQTLNLACRYGQVEVVAILLSYSCPFPRRYDSALQEPCQHGHQDVLRLLVWNEEHDSDVSSRLWNHKTFGVERKFLIHFAAEFGYVHILGHICQITAPWRLDTLEDVSGRTTYHYAAMNGHFEVIDALVKKGLNSYDEKCRDQEMTPLMLAAQAGHAKAVQSLLAAGADPMVCGSRRLSIEFEDFPPNVFLTDIPYVETAYSAGKAPMAVHIAARHGHAEVLKVLPMEVGFLQ